MGYLIFRVIILSMFDYLNDLYRNHFVCCLITILELLYYNVMWFKLFVGGLVGYFGGLVFVIFDYVFNSTNFEIELFVSKNIIFSFYLPVVVQENNHICYTKNSTTFLSQVTSHIWILLQVDIRIYSPSVNSITAKTEQNLFKKVQ